MIARTLILIAMSWAIVSPGITCSAQGRNAADTAANESNLDDRQGSVAKRYQRLEELLLRLADMEVAENPERAAMLRRAAKMSRDKFVLQRLQEAGSAIEGGEYKKALDSQKLASTEMRSILKLLQSEDRSKRIRDEKERYKKLISDLKRNLNNQRSARARTENGADMNELKKQQESITKKSDELKKRLNEDNQPIDPSDSEQSKDSDDAKEPKASDEKDADGKPEPSDPKPSDPTPSGPQPSESQPGDSQPSDSKPSDSKSSDSKSSDSKSSGSKSSESKPSDSKSSGSKSSESKPSDSKPSDSQPSDSQPSDSQPSDEPSPASQDKPSTPEQDVEQKLSEAIKKMKEAEAELEKSKRSEAAEKQSEAEEKLRAAIDRLEKILRQLREEEMKRELAKLESRVRKMAAMQQTVLEDTQTLAKVPKSQRDRSVDLKSGKLSFEEKKITQEADRALLVLREEGSSVAFPEVMSQIRADTVRVSEMLAASKMDELAQGLQEDILAALEEMIAALAKAQRDLEKQQKQAEQGQSPPSGQQEQPLVEALAELKLIRTMETRIQNTTKRYSKRLELGDSSGEEIRPLLKDLSDRQRRLYRITRDLVMKRNQ